MTAPFATIVADPPWAFGDALPGRGRGAGKHYALMPTWEIQRFALPPIAPDAYLFLWRVASMPQDALDVCKAWGFTPKTEIIWRKQTAKGKRHFGMGRTVRSEHEACIVAVRGKPQRKHARQRSVFEAVAPAHHSAKPEEFFALVEALTPGPYLEVFARTRRPGWAALGNELDLDERGETQ